LSDSDSEAHDVIELTDDEGQTRAWHLLDRAEVSEAAYVVIQAVDDEEEVLILRVTDEGLVTLEDDEFDRVAQAFEVEWEDEEEPGNPAAK
jgi:hypothetical protein